MKKTLYKCKGFKGKFIMGLSVGNNKGQAFAVWSAKVAKNDPSAEEKFRINRKGNTDPNEYHNLINQLSKDYISLMDTDGDGAVSFNEFVKYNVDNFKKEHKITDAQVTQMTSELKQTYDKLNIDNENASKGKLDEREIMSFFFTMDTNNDDMVSDGFISKAELIDTDIMLGDNSKVGKLFKKCLDTNYFEIFKNYKK